MNWYPLSYHSRTDFVQKITRTSIDFSDKILSIGALMNEQEKAFIVEEGTNRLLPYDNNFQNAVTFEVT
jgi:hypothetical protein